jgi:hypothetical protein
MGTFASSRTASDAGEVFMVSLVVIGASEGDGGPLSEVSSIIVEARDPGLVDGVGALSTTMSSVGC